MLKKLLCFLWCINQWIAMQSLRSNRGDNVVKNEEKCGKAASVTLSQGSLKVLEVDGCAKWMRKEWREKMEMGRKREHDATEAHIDSGIEKWEKCDEKKMVKYSYNKIIKKDRKKIHQKGTQS